ncbi:MAG: type II secretion system minor pseudopilin GspJ [Proteobacteria bacterium]|nr:type II secretion system minor pseudopilin GspJ [Pseudomonadota bacterium]
MRRSRGFTLLELLVAMFIAALIFAMGYGTINQAVKSREGLEAQQKKLLELQTAIRTMEQDFVQLAPRPIRDPVGGTYQPALLANSNGSSGGLGSSNSSSSGSLGSSSGTQPVVVLTRTGWTNPTGLQRPGLQRVAYYFQDGTLRREYWTVLDPTQASQAVRRDLISHLKSVSLRFMDVQSNTSAQTPPPGSSDSPTGANINWSPIWPPVNGANQDNRRYRPIGVEITLDTEEWGKIVRYVEIAG